MSTEPTSALTFDDLILEVAIFLSVAYYGAAGNEVAQIPVDVVDLAECKRHVNNAIRMFIANAPPAGWRWSRPVADVVLWPSVALDDLVTLDSSITATGVYGVVTTITATEAVFTEAMVGKTIIVTGETAGYEIASYVSSTVVTIAGDHEFAAKTFSVADTVATGTDDLVLLDEGITATGVYDTVTTITASEAVFTAATVGKTIVVTGTGSYTIVTYTSPTVVTIAGDHAFVDKTFSVSEAGITTITATAASFYPSMEGKTIVITGVGSYAVLTYTSSTIITITGNNAFVAKSFSIAADGDYGLPRTFGGAYSGPITYAVGTNTGAHIEWVDESHIRSMREPTLAATGYPHLAAVRRNPDTNRRWELAVYPTPSEEMTVQFPYELHFDDLTTGTDTPPASFQYDEAIKAACLAVAERDTEDGMGGTKWTYYTNVALPNAHRTDARTAPRRLGHMNPRGLMSQDDYRGYVQRATVDTTSI